MKKFSLFCILLIVFVCFSCNKANRITREIKEMIGRNIVFPSGYKLHCCNDSLWEQSSLCDIKIVTYVDNLPCTECGLRTMHDWIDDIKTIDNDVSYILVVQTEEPKDLFGMLDSIQLEAPFLFYPTDTFRLVNSLDVLARNKTFLLNKENKIVLVGEPFGNEKLTQLYKKTIASLKEEYAHERREKRK